MHRGGRDYNSIAAHLDQSNYLANQQQQLLGLAVSFSSLSMLYKKNGLWAKLASFDFFSFNFCLQQSHILSIGWCLHVHFFRPQAVSQFFFFGLQIFHPKTTTTTTREGHLFLEKMVWVKPISNNKPMCKYNHSVIVSQVAFNGVLTWRVTW
jgi:hypothetical protein